MKGSVERIVQSAEGEARRWGVRSVELRGRDKLTTIGLP